MTEQQTLVLNLSGKLTQTQIACVKQHDHVSRVLNIKIISDSTTTMFPENTTAHLLIRYSDYQVSRFPVSLTGDMVTIPLTQTFTSLSGRHYAEIHFSYDGCRISTPTFIIEVIPSVSQEQEVKAHD